jgi:AcrR family transcriptional regulator
MGLKERREREREGRRQQILDAARQMLVEKGLNGTSMNQVAQLGELGVATIYFYYRSKEELFAALQQEGLELLYSRIEQASRKGKSNADKIRRAALAYLRFSEENKDYFDIMNYFLSSPEEIFTPELKHKVDQRGEKILGLVVKMVEDGVEKGEFRRVEARNFSLLLWAALHGLTHFKKMKETLLQGRKHERVFLFAVDHLVGSLAVGG